MAHKAQLRRDSSDEETLAYLGAHEEKGLLRFLTCGSVDDGKSTLIGRLLYESQLVFSDQLAAVEAESRRRRGPGEGPAPLDLSLLLDGLQAEREQGITIDVAYRYFSTERRHFIVADAPGHEQYTRNMVTAASTADLGIVLIDAHKGVLRQTRRHSAILALLGVRHVVLAVNKMDTVAYDEAAFRAHEREYLRFAAQVGLDPAAVRAIPLSGLVGDNVTAPSPRMPWYQGPTLMEHLSTVEVEEQLEGRPFRLAVQWVSRGKDQPGAAVAARGYCGLIASGAVAVGDALRVLPSGTEARVRRICLPGGPPGGPPGADGELPRAVAGQSVALYLDREVDVSRGDLLCAAAAPPQVADQLQATLVWMHEEPLLVGRPYLLKLGARTVGASVTALRHKIHVDTLEPLAARQLALNEIGVCNLSLDRPLPFEPYRDCRELGGFLLIDRVTNDTVGAGMVDFALRRADNIHWQALAVSREARAAQKGQRQCVLWLTGLSGAGKSTIADLVERKLLSLGRHSYLLDGDNVRHGLNRDLGFTAADRVENIRRVSEVAQLMADAGLIVLVAFISPFRAERQLARERARPGEFFEIYVDTPLQEAERRDPKGLYRKARRGELPNFTGIDSPYEPPERPELTIDTTRESAEEAADRIVAHLRAAGLLDGGSP